MRFRAVAKNSERSNAAGTLELECAPQALRILLRGVFSLHEGYAPSALVSGTLLEVPWSSVTETRLEGEELVLEIDPAIAPLNRFRLIGFSSVEEPIAAEEQQRRKLMFRAAGVGLAVCAGLALYSAGARAGAGRGPSLAGAVALVSVLLVLGVGFSAQRWFSGQVPSLSGDAAREAFLSELVQFRPALIRLPAAVPKPLEQGLWQFERALPRTTLAVVITLSAALLGVLLTTRVIVLDEASLRRPESAPAAEPADAPRPVTPPPTFALAATALPKAALGAASGPQETSSAPPSGTLELGADCSCRRSDSPLWAQPIPKLSLIVIAKRVRKGRGSDESRRKNYLELELGVVNNGASELPELSLLVESFERDPPPSSKRYPVATRPLFYEGPLRPAQAIKWSVEAEGSEFDAHHGVQGDIGPFGDDAAPANSFAELLRANHRPVRLHAAMMLTFLNDPRAREAVLELREALREDEAPYLNRLLKALAAISVCGLEIEPRAGQGKACVFNRSAEPQRELGLKVRALSGTVPHSEPLAPPPEVLVEQSYRVPGELAAGSGKIARFTLSGVRHQSTLEAFVDRYDLLHR
jgi:hypothetical protein